MSCTFWPIHSHHELVARWAEVVGVEHVTVIVVGDRDRRALPRAFESLLGLRDGTLVGQVSAFKALGGGYVNQGSVL